MGFFPYNFAVDRLLEINLENVLVKETVNFVYSIKKK